MYINALVVALGTLLLLPSFITIRWFYMMNDWPMSIGGKPNWTFCQNVPVVDDVPVLTIGAILYLGIIAQVLVAFSLIYAVFRIFYVRRRRRSG